MTRREHLLKAAVKAAGALEMLREASAHCRAAGLGRQADIVRHELIPRVSRFEGRMNGAVLAEDRSR